MVVGEKKITRTNSDCYQKQEAGSQDQKNPVSTGKNNQPMTTWG
jgi:hypothetical protein